MMDITYCFEQCKIGKAASAKCLAENHSVLDASFDFWRFVEKCTINCMHKENSTTNTGDLPKNEDN